MKVDICLIFKKVDANQLWQADDDIAGELIILFMDLKVEFRCRAWRLRRNCRLAWRRLKPPRGKTVDIDQGQAGRAVRAPAPQARERGSVGAWECLGLGMMRGSF
ncbi:MAG TPA: hypothetical protein VN028_00215 [Rhodocyclaceae bacterium]|nr:hypothetical protein [Rhodocyclaceae bacterium]